jgi:SAM-dependent methyltransferase
LFKRFARRSQLIRNFRNNQFPIASTHPPYTLFARYYDGVMQNIDYKEWVKYLLKVRKRFCPDAHLMVDLACGTGNVLIPLLNKGYNVIGIDSSSDMLKQIHKKGIKPSYQTELIQMDMRQLGLPSPSDFMYSLNDSFNYLLSHTELNQQFQVCYENLRPGGLLFFDLSSEENIYQNFTLPIFETQPHFALNWTNQYNKQSRILESNLDFFDLEDQQVYREVHLQRIHDIDEVVSVAEAVGFHEQHVFDGFTFAPPHAETLIYHVVLKK